MSEIQGQGADIIDFGRRRAEKLAETTEPLPAEDVMLECPICDNKAFTLLTTNREGASVPGWDVVCTACRTTIDVNGKME